MIERQKYEDVKRMFADKGLQLLSSEYKNSHEKLVCKNEDGYYGHMALLHLKTGQTFMPFSKNNIFAMENLKLFFLKNKIRSKILFEEYGTCKEKYKFLCECGSVFYKTLDDVIQDKRCVCPSCGYKLIKEKLSHTYDYVKKTLENCGYKMLQDFYDGNKKFIEVEDSDGFRGFLRFNQHNLCNILKFDTKINFKNYIFNINRLAEIMALSSRAIKIIGEKHGENTIVEFECDCGNAFTARKRSFFNGKNRCPICSKAISSYELSVKNWLDGNKMNYIYQKSFSGCKYKNPLPFDFFLYDKNILIEVDGEGHYKRINFGGMSDEAAELNFQNTKRNDKIKTDYCVSVGIMLIRIPYYEIANLNYNKILENNLLGQN